MIQRFFWSVHTACSALHNENGDWTLRGHLRRQRDYVGDRSLAGTNWHRATINSRESPAASVTPATLQYWTLSDIWIREYLQAKVCRLVVSTWFPKLTSSQSKQVHPANIFIIFTESWHLSTCFSCFVPVFFTSVNIFNIHFSWFNLQKMFLFQGCV